MRNYDLMRAILARTAHANDELAACYFADLGEFDELKEELERLKEEGLIEHNIVWEAYKLASGKVIGITADGKAFLRNIENERVWRLVYETLKAADLDLSYPLLKEVCEEIVRRYVMGKIPKEL